MTGDSAFVPSKYGNNRSYLHSNIVGKRCKKCNRIIIGLKYYQEAIDSDGTTGAAVHAYKELKSGGQIIKSPIAKCFHTDDEFMELIRAEG